MFEWCLVVASQLWKSGGSHTLEIVLCVTCILAVLGGDLQLAEWLLPLVQLPIVAVEAITDSLDGTQVGALR